METESIRLLRWRRSEVDKLLAEVRAREKALSDEMAQIDAGIAAMSGGQLIPPSGVDATLRANAYHARKASPDTQGMTMKQLVMKALEERLPNGATANELLDFFAKEWGRTDITRTSLSPQLSRLKGEGKIALMGKVWMLREKYDETYGHLVEDENLAIDAQKEIEPSKGETPEDGSETALDAQAEEATEC